MSTNVQAVSPAESGGSLRPAFYGLITFALLSVDAYHVFNYTFHHMSADSLIGTAFNFFLACAIALLAFVIKPATILFVNAMRLRDPLIIRIGTGAMLGALLFGVFIATSSSQNTLSETRSNNLDTYGSQLETLKRRETDANNMLTLARTSAANMDVERAQRYLAAAQVRYSREMVSINESRSGLMRDKPLAQSHNAGFVAVDSAVRDAVFSLFITLAGVVATIFSVMHLKAEHRIPAFSLASKLNHDWESYRENYRSASFDVNPLRGMFKGLFMGVKKDVVEPRDQIDSPRTIAGNSRHKPSPAPQDDSPKKDTGNTDTGAQYPADDAKVYLLCPNSDCRALYHPKKSSLPDPDGTTKGKMACANCSQPFVWMDNTLSDKQGETIQNQYQDKSQESPIPDEFPANSSQIPVDKQADSSARNSAGISQEFAKNSAGISSSQELPKHSGMDRSIDLSKVAAVDGRDEKLAALASTIDQLSADPASDGLIFSPTKTKKELHLGYELIQGVFKQKQDEGKISMTKPYKIVYVGAIND